MTSEEFPRPGTVRAPEPEERGDLGEEPGDLGAGARVEQGAGERVEQGAEARVEQGGKKQGDDPRDDGGRLNLTDPKAIRALAHPVRWALLEALGQAGTLTATQASEMLGESPANCAFHLRTLAKYGFVEEAGGGRGRERPWRRLYDTMSWRTRQDDPQASLAAEALDQVWLDRSLGRARRSLTSMSAWPKGLTETLGGSTGRLYLTPQEAEELYKELRETFERLTRSDRYRERRDPDKRPADALPIELVLLGYPILGLPPLPAADAGADGESDDDTAAEGLVSPGSRPPEAGQNVRPPRHNG
jgi:predicted transcriptional regulator